MSEKLSRSRAKLKGKQNFTTESVETNTAAKYLVECAPVGLAFIDLEFRYRSINAMLAKMNGISQEEHLGKRVIDVLPSYAGLILPRLEQVLRTNEPILDLEFQLRPPSDPHVLHSYLVSYFPMHDYSSQLIGIGAAVTDITKQKTAEHVERQLKRDMFRERAILETVAAQMPAGILIVELPDGRSVYHNAAFSQILGHYEALTSVRDYGVYKGIHADGTTYKPEEYPTARAVLNGEVIVAEELLYRRKNAEVATLSVSAARVYDSLGRPTHAVCVFFDITARENHLAELRDEIELREHFVNSLTHDLRIPLSAARMSSEIVLRYPEKPEIHDEYLQKSIVALKTCDRMISDLLDSHRVKSGQSLPIVREVCDAIEIGTNVVAQLNLIYGDLLVLSSTESSIKGWWSADSLRRILENLCSNAMKYGVAGGLVVVQITRVPNNVIIEVHNSGEVIPLAEQKNLFQMFNRAESAKSGKESGWGIGLALVKALAEAHGGHVEVKSEKPFGTSFFVTLPFSKPTSDKSAS